MPLFDVRCTKCKWWRTDMFVKSGEEPICEMCLSPMEKLMPVIAGHVMAAGRSAESKREWGQRERARLEQRSRAYDESPQGKQEREATVDRLRKNGTIPDGWNA